MNRKSYRVIPLLHTLERPNFHFFQGCLLLIVKHFQNIHNSSLKVQHELRHLIVHAQGCFCPCSLFSGVLGNHLLAVLRVWVSLACCSMCLILCLLTKIAKNRSKRSKIALKLLTVCETGLHFRATSFGLARNQICLARKHSVSREIKHWCTTSREL